jgi:repressor LexA
MMQKRGVASTRQRVLENIRDFIERHGYAPSVREIRDALHISSTSVVQYHLDALEVAGEIRRSRDHSRTIRLAGQSGSMVPVLGTIAAGLPLPTVGPDTWHAEVQENIEVPAAMAHGRQVYALRVRGTSMIDALIDDGDIVLIDNSRDYHDGQVVAVRLKDSGEVTLKRLYREGERVRLQPANSLMAPIYVPAKNVEVQGKLAGLIRGYQNRPEQKTRVKPAAGQS